MTGMCIIFHLPLLCIFVLQQGVLSLRLTKIHVPRYPKRGELAILECEFEIGNNKLYSVKWYKDNEEFFRFVPRDEPPISSFKVDGVRVEHRLSSKNVVALKGVNMKTSGLYRCEVSAEAPSFASVHGEGNMVVVVIPKNDPHIIGLRNLSQVDQEVNLNCTSGKSFPESKLKWFINDEEVGPGSLLRYEPVYHHTGLVTSTLGLRFHARPRHFLDGNMKVLCVATISFDFWKGSAASVMGSHSEHVLGNREALLQIRSSSHHTSASIFFTAVLTSLVSVRSCRSCLWTLT